MAILFRLAVETDFTTATTLWNVTIPIAALPGDYMLAMLASPTGGVIWSSPGWEQLDGFTTTQFSLGGFAQSPQPVPISYGIFGKFLTPFDTNPSGTGVATFAVGQGPTAVIGSSPGSAAGVALMASYIGVNRAEPTRWRLLSQTPALAITYNGPTPTQTYPPFTSVTSATVPAVFADMNDWIVSPLITPGNCVNVALPGASFIFRASTTGGNGIVIALVDENVNQAGLQSGLVWTATSMPTPLLTEAIALWPDNSYLDNEIRFFATMDRNPVHFGYDYDQEPTIIANSVGYLFSVYAAPREAWQSRFASGLLNGVNLLITRSDGSTTSQALTMSSSGYYAYCNSLNGWFPYTGRYYFQLQLQWANGSTSFSSQAYINVSPQGGQ